jgi:hypothetical protein
MSKAAAVDVVIARREPSAPGSQPGGMTGRLKRGDLDLRDKLSVWRRLHDGVT